MMSHPEDSIYEQKLLGSEDMENSTDEKFKKKDDNKQVWESPDFTITKMIHKQGLRHLDKPRFGSTGQIEIHDITCHGITLDELTDDFFYSKYFNKRHSGQVQIGNGDSEIDKTLERLIQSMFPKEEAEAALRVNFDIQRNKKEKCADNDKTKWIEIECKVVLTNLLNAQPIYKWIPATKFEKAKEANASAVILYKLNRFLDAFHKFRLTLTLVTYILEENKETSMDKEMIIQAEEMRLTCFSNLAACQFQWGNFEYVVDLCTKVLAVQKSNVKLLYRRGTAYLSMKDYELSRIDLVEAHRLDPSNKAINDKLGQLRIMEKKSQEEMGNRLKKMFI